MTDDIASLDSGGPWVVVVPYDGGPVCVRFSEVRDASETARFLGQIGGTWSGPTVSEWTTSLDRTSFMAGVNRIRDEIAAGNVYQANLTRIMSAPLAGPDDVGALARILMAENPAPHSAVISLSDPDIRIVSASPELFIARDGNLIRTSPIKGTAATADGFLPKDAAENIMIVDLMRNDLGRICDWGSVRATELLATERHPGLFHLVSTVEGVLRWDCGWSEIIAATFPPGSVTGAPKIASVDLIDELEPVSRRFYCGTIGSVDEDGRLGSLNVAIRTFWIENGSIHFGTGGGITYDSDPEGEWRETELKAHNLIRAVSRPVTEGVG